MFSTGPDHAELEVSLDDGSEYLIRGQFTWRLDPDALRVWRIDPDNPDSYTGDDLALIVDRAHFVAAWASN